ncbi:MAG: hypothetical protein BGO85_01145 [Enterobacter sp. 56-7]|nr:MAG: hypothetical protein BGO85_01145 [Enterobacter sp. 56-7]
MKHLCKQRFSTVAAKRTDPELLKMWKMRGSDAALVSPVADDSRRLIATIVRLQWSTGHRLNV